MGGLLFPGWRGPFPPGRQSRDLSIFERGFALDHLPGVIVGQPLQGYHWPGFPVTERSRSPGDRSAVDRRSRSPPLPSQFSSLPLSQSLPLTVSPSHSLPLSQSPPLRSVISVSKQISPSRFPCPIRPSKDKHLCRNCSVQCCFHFVS